MYWPLGTPRIFYAKGSNSPTTYDSDDAHDSETLVAVSPNDFGEITGTGLRSEGRKLGKEKEEEAGSASLQSSSTSHIDNKKSRSSLNVTISEDVNKKAGSSAILALKMSRNGALFATINISELTIWQTKVRLDYRHESQGCSETYGIGADI